MPSFKLRYTILGLTNSENVVIGSDMIHRIGRNGMLNKRKEAYRSICRMLSVMFILCAALLTPVEAVTPHRDYWPTENWRISTPETEGMDSAKLLKVIPFIVNNLPDIQSLLVVRNGCLVFENYYGPGMPDRQDTVHSVTKSVTSALVGIARSQKLLTDLNQTLPDFFSKYFDTRTDPAKRKISLKHLLTMTAGLQPIKVKNWSLLLRWNFAPDRVDFTLDLPLIHPPGQVFDYSNPISHLLSIILTEKSGLNLREFARRNLFEPLGIKPRFWRQDAQGYYNGHGSLYLTAREMAKFGFLYLNRGVWDGKQIIPANWIEESTRSQVKAGRDYGYGYQWWIRPVAGCPSYRAWGRNGQFIVVVPEMDLVIAVTSRTGLPGRSSGHYSPLFDIVAEAVIDKSCRWQSGSEQVISGDKAKLFGEIETNMGPLPLQVSTIIKENGSWKWYGNQKER